MSMIKVPVFASFASSEVIGELRIDSSKLPPDPNFCFALGVMCDVKVDEIGKLPTRQISGPYKLQAVAIANDGLYADYLKQVGVI